jgi:DNA-binding NarL/FixJ family response regulator
LDSRGKRDARLIEGSKPGCGDSDSGSATGGKVVSNSTRRPPGQRFRVLLVDDHPIVRYAMAQLMNQEEDLVVCGEASTPAEALTAISAARPEIVLVDISLGRANGLDLAKTIHRMDPELPILVLSMHDESTYAPRALQAGAMGYVMKQEAPETILGAVRTVLDGECFISERMGATRGAREPADTRAWPR